MKKRNLQSSYNYKFQEESKRKRDYEKLKKIREAAKKIPEDAKEELEYMKKLLSGEDVGNFGPEEPVLVETNDWGWMHYTSPTSPISAHQVQAQVQAQMLEDLKLTKLTLSDFLSGIAIRQRKRK